MARPLLDPALVHPKSEAQDRGKKGLFSDFVASLANIGVAWPGWAGRVVGNFKLTHCPEEQIDPLPPDYSG